MPHATTKAESKVEIKIGDSTYCIDTDALGSIKDIAFTVQINIDGFAYTIKIQEGYVLRTDSLTHLLESVGSQAAMMTKRCLKQWLTAGEKIRGDKDIEVLHDRYKKDLLDKLLITKILEEPKDAGV